MKFQVTLFIVYLNYQAIKNHAVFPSAILKSQLWCFLFLLEIHYTNAAEKTIGRV